ncbi:MAG TPA: TM0106 family RecB-like putative nuclease, partial [Candidatus Dormibacteraeota bacterium]|nr:TM0106 family RecB-like putative nuclease [Candidatus Dormibacteraeota bacterium]
MELVDGIVVHSATDLVGFLACEHLTNLERAAVAGLVERPERRDPELDLIARRGLEHERRFLEELTAAGLGVVEIAQDRDDPDRGRRLRDAMEATRRAMADGADVIYQAALFDGRWRGYADFLRRVDAPSGLGSWSYEVWDTKLARHTKGSAILQLSLYSDLLSGEQGTMPERMHVALGGSEHATEHHRTADYLAYYRLIRRMYETSVEAGAPSYPPPTRPDPVAHCDVCRWNLECAAARRAADDLSLVAGITARQRCSLRDRGVSTRRGLAALPIPLEPPLEGSSRDAVARVRDQARIQVEGEDAGILLYELLEPARLLDGSLEPDRGLLSLPPPSPGDLFFDIEGDPFAFDDGIDYLFGVLEPGRRDERGEPLFHALWSRDPGTGDVTPEAEKAAFESLIDLIVDRLRADPGLHVYHYAPYEPTAMGRLMGRYATREAEVDELLRGRVFVDLFRAVRQGLRASVESYSIKRLEPLYGFERSVDLRDAGSSIVAFETWLQVGGDPVDDPGILERIEGYNRDDCVSNMRLRGWLEDRRSELEARVGEALPRPGPGEPASVELRESLARVAAVESRLVADVPADPAARTAEAHGRWLLAQLLSWHRREDKSAWWRYFRLLEMTDAERLEERDALAGLQYEGVVDEVAHSLVHRYRYPPQEHAIVAGMDARDPMTGRSAGEVVRVDDTTGTIELKRGRTSGVPHPTSLVPMTVVGTSEQRDSLLRLGEWVADHGIDGDGPWRVARDLLLRRP